MAFFSSLVDNVKSFFNSFSDSRSTTDAWNESKDYLSRIENLNQKGTYGNLYKYNGRIYDVPDNKINNFYDSVRKDISFPNDSNALPEYEYGVDPKHDSIPFLDKVSETLGPVNDEIGQNVKGALESAGNTVFNIGSGLGDIVSSIGPLLSKIAEDPETYFDYFRNGKANEYNYKINQETNAANLQIAKDTNATNKAVADENLGFQRELQEYNKALQERLFEREDTSYQRTAQDMISAGLNPLSMQGTNGAGQVISQTPLHNEYQAQQSNPMQSFQYQAGGIQSVLATMSSIADSVRSIFDSRRSRDLLQTQIDKGRLDNTIYAYRNGINYSARYGDGRFMVDDIRGYATKGIDLSRDELDFMHKDRELNHKIKLGMYDSDLREERILTAIEDWVSNGRMKKLLDNLGDTAFNAIIGGYRK